MNPDREKHIDILLATYNGAPFLSEQIESILNQTYQNWTLIIHDDNSTDNTVSVINHFVRQCPEKLRFIDDSIRLGSPTKNFDYLLRHVSADYMMFCDQDDVWKKDKIEKTMNIMQQAESSHGKSTPLLVHSDLEIVDEQLNVISPSMWTYQKLNQELTNDLSALAVQNTVTGCTMMFNKSLYIKSVPIPEQAFMHDWWMALIACKHGQIVPIKESLIKYRQHEDNQVGAVRPGIRHYLHKLQGLSSTVAYTFKAYSQAKAANISLSPRRFLTKKIVLVMSKIR